MTERFHVFQMSVDIEPSDEQIKRMMKLTNDYHLGEGKNPNVIVNGEITPDPTIDPTIEKRLQEAHQAIRSGQHKIIMFRFDANTGLLTQLKG